MVEFKIGQKVVYNPAKLSVHHIGRITAIDDFIHVQFEIGSNLFFKLDGYDELFDRQLTVVDDSYVV